MKKTAFTPNYFSVRSAGNFYVLETSEFRYFVRCPLLATLLRATLMFATVYTTF